jgi:cytochrome o ubiquinol oxidase operon protein cyoD
MTAADLHAGHAVHHDHGGEEPHVSRRGYLLGFVLSVVLTAIPFALVMSEVIPNRQITAFTVLVFAMVQIVVHMVLFLHMNPRVEAGWSMMALIFTLIMVVIGLSGTLWVMYHLTTNMMPMPAMSAMP